MDALSRRITVPKSFPGLKEISRGLSFMDDTFKDIGVYIVEAQELLCASFLGVGCAYALRMTLTTPGDACNWAQFHGTEFIKADNVTIWWCFFIKFQNAVFFTSKFGSGDSFHVFVR